MHAHTEKSTGKQTVISIISTGRNNTGSYWRIHTMSKMTIAKQLYNTEPRLFGLCDTGQLRYISNNSGSTSGRNGINSRVDLELVFNSTLTKLL